MPKKTHQIGLRVDDNTFNWLKEMAKAKKFDGDVSKVVREAISELKNYRDLQLTGKLMQEDRHLFVIEHNNGDLKLKKVRRELVKI